MKKTVLSAFLLLSMLPLTLFASEYVVAQKDPAAADTNIGSADKPLKTIAAGFAKIKPGDTLLVRAGTYRETLILRKEASTEQGVNYPAVPNGDAEHPIRILNWPGERPVVKGSDLVTDWKKHKEAADRGAIYVHDWATNTQQVFCDGKILQQIAGDMPPDVQQWWRGRKGKSLEDLEKGSFYYDQAGKKLYVWLADGSDPNKHEMEVSVRPHLLRVTVNYTYIRGFTFTHSNTTLIAAWPGSSLVASHCRIENCEFTWNDFGGLGMLGEFNDIIRCKCNYNGDSGFGAGGRGHRIVGCEFSFNNYRHFNAGWHAGAMKFNGYDILFSDCTCEGNIDSPGFWNDGECQNITIENSRSINNSCGVMIEIGERATIRNNILVGNGIGVYLSNSSFCNVYNNVFYRNKGAGVAALGVNRVNAWFFDDEKSGFGPARGNVVWGNLFVDNNWREGKSGPAPINASDLILPNPEISSNDGNISDYNLFYRSNKTTGTFAHNWGEKSFDNLKEWQEKAGQDKHSIIAQPLFLDTAKLDFRPAKGSPAIRLVRPRMGAGTDFEGARRDDRAYYTAGPFEAPPGFAPPPPPKPTTLPAPVSVELPAEFVKPTSGNGEMATFAEAMKELPTKTVNGKTTVMIKGVPFSLVPGKAMLLAGGANKIRIPVNRGVMKLYLLHAVIDAPESRMVGLCKVLRQDGMGIGLDWYTPTNIGPSVGKWENNLTENAADRKTEVAWQSKDGKVRLFLTTWNNDNYWYPIRDLEWNLMDNKPTLVVLGITAQPDK